MAQIRRGLTDTSSEGYAGCCEALAALDLHPVLGSISAPTLVIAGAEDPATPPDHGRAIADGIAGARFELIEGAAHLANIEKAEAGHSADYRIHRRRTGGTVSDSEAYETGMKTRREVLGDAHVDRATASAGEFGAPFQEFITRYAWGAVWSRPGIDRRMRSAITLTALVSLRAENELGMHVRAALGNGLTADEIREVILHTAVYAGVPAANAAFAVAKRVLSEEGAI